jgi:hypothetical protein
MSHNNKGSMKAQAITALRDAIEEISRDGGPRPVVLGALLAEAQTRVEAIQELVKPHKPKVTA